jgi:hypothetical protein
MVIMALLEEVRGSLLHDKDDLKIHYVIMSVVH